MKIALTAKEKNLDTEMDPRFGRAPFFMVYDTEWGSYSFIDNEQNLNAAQGAGIQAAQNVIKAGADVLITGSCGPKAFQVLQTSGIEIVVGASGPAKEVIERYKNGELKKAQGPDVESHWV
ncbi:MAG TPA: dinitrogenase iron-molybdenum cofactor biosynthesis protein [Firmicutes bacterium]|nr:dinitrogenase iron-molybdenum cofactor biosynthesis protein [Bacillota bacterium]